MTHLQKRRFWSARGQWSQSESMAVRGMVRAVSRSASARCVTRMFLIAGLETGGLAH